MDNDLLIRKAIGITNSIEKMPDGEKSGQPTGEYGKDYNNLRMMVIEANTEIEKLIPPAVEVYEFHPGDEVTKQSYSEIHTYCSQIIELLEGS